MSSAPVTEPRPKRVRAMDFSRPTKFTPEQERRVRRTVEDFCRAASGRLAAEVRAPVELEVVSATQLAWADAHAQMPEDAIAVHVPGSVGGTPLLLCLDARLVVRVIEVLLGGSPVDAVPSRRLTDIDWALGTHFADRLVGQLAPVWEDALGIKLELGTLEPANDAAPLTQVSEPTLAVACEVRVNGDAHGLWLFVPWTSFAPVASRFEAAEDVNQSGDPGPIAAAMAGVVMTVRAEAGATDLPLSEVLELRPGDVIRLDARVADGVTLYAGDAPVRRAAPGTSNGRRAVQVGDA